jgi:hypothetical protein
MMGVSTARSAEDDFTLGIGVSKFAMAPLPPPVRPEFELYELTAKSAEMFDGVVSKQTTLLEKEIVDLTTEADQLSKEIGKLTTQVQPGKSTIS